MKKQKYYFYYAGTGSFSGFMVSESPIPEWTEYVGNPSGPFKTLGEAKKDALSYFRADVMYARNCIAEIKKAGIIEDEGGRG
jgi:hypothetical protein